MGLFGNAQSAQPVAGQQQAGVTLVTLIDDRGHVVKTGELAVKDCPFLAFQGDSILVAVPGKDFDWGNRPLKPNQRAVRVVSLSKVAKMVFTDPA